MEYTLVGVKRGEFTNQNGDNVKFSHLFLVGEFEEGTEGFAGMEALKVSFDYDAVGDLLGLTYPQQVDLQFNAKGKCTKLILLNADNGRK